LLKILREKKDIVLTSHRTYTTTCEIISITKIYSSTERLNCKKIYKKRTNNEGKINKREKEGGRNKKEI
jgi:hypothetical protein